MNGKIYKIVTAHSNEIYIGSTINSLEYRLYSHIEKYNGWINRKFKKGYCSSYEILKYGDYKIELLEDYPFVDLKDLQKREGWYQLNSICVNLLIAGYRPIDIININENLLYHCICCKLLICNTYPKRLLHLRTSAHRKNRNNIHKNIAEIL